MMRKNNSGMSFIEMAVTVLIVGILSVSVGMSVNTINAPKPMDSARRISSALDKARLETMSRVDKNMVAALFMEDGKHFIAILEDGDTPSSADAKTVGIGSRDLKISINGKTMDETPVMISFDKGTGAFLDQDELFQDGSAEILIQGTKEVRVRLVKLTGNSYIES